jgi:hypothetical protein
LKFPKKVVSLRGAFGERASNLRNDLAQRDDWRAYVRVLRGEQTIAQVARDLGVSRDKIKWQLRRMKAELRGLLADYDPDEES